MVTEKKNSALTPTQPHIATYPIIAHITHVLTHYIRSTCTQSCVHIQVRTQSKSQIISIKKASVYYATEQNKREREREIER